MGCKGSKDDKQDNKAIDSDFEWIGMGRFDDFFRSARDLLQAAEEIRGGLEDNREKGLELSHAFKLKEAKFHDIVQVLFWTLSAEKDGKIVDTGLEIASDLPYVKLEGGKVSHDTYALYECFTGYVKACFDGPKNLKEIAEKLQELSQKLPDVTTEGKNDIQNSSWSFGDKAKAIAKIGKNSKKFTKEVAKVKTLNEILQTAATDVKEMVPKLKEMMTAADVIGAKAHADGLKKPGEIFDKYHTGERGTAPPKKKEEKKKEEKKEEKKGI